jgi:hypothetical protein
VHPEQVVFADPHRNAGDGSYDEGISGEQFALYIQGSAEEISGYDSDKRDDADKRFHDVLLLDAADALCGQISASAAQR